MRLIDAYNIRPDEIEAEDVALFIVKAVVTRSGRYRLYRCPYIPVTSNLVGACDNVPQGDRLTNEQEICEALFPSLAMVAEPD